MALSKTFCMDTGQVKTGIDSRDTYLKILQQVLRVTAPIANGIASEYPNLPSLVDGFRRQGNLAVASLKVSRFDSFPSFSPYFLF